MKKIMKTKWFIIILSSLTNLIVQEIVELESSTLRKIAILKILKKKYIFFINNFILSTWIDSTRKYQWAEETYLLWEVSYCELEINTDRLI